VSTLVLDRRRGRHAGQYVPFTFAPGQFAWLRLQRSVAAAEHPFTIASSAADGDVLEFTVRRHTGGFTDGIGGLRPGQRSGSTARTARSPPTTGAAATGSCSSPAASASPR
jgi:predicted ferric reductase